MNNESFAESSRRRFLLAALAGTGAIPVAGWCAAADGDDASAVRAGQFHEPARDLPLVRDADVIVCGAGPAGVSAAIAAARAGARVRLFESNGCLGGVWTAGLLTWIFDFKGDGFTAELTRQLDARDARRGDSTNRFVYEPDEMKRLLEDLCVEAGVQFRLDTRLVAAYREGRQLTTVITESRSGREAWEAPVFIDATGDGALGAMAGCTWELGNMEDDQAPQCECQPLTMNALAAVKDVTKMSDFISFYQGDLNWHVEATKHFKAEIQRAGLDPSYGMPTIFHVRDNVVLLMMNHEYGIRPDDADAMTRATVRARKEIFDIVHALRKLGGVWEGLQVVATAEQIGIRDGKRIRGRYTVTKQDLIDGARHEDAVARVTFGVDIHAKNKKDNDKLTIERGGVSRTIPYDIPLRALIAKDVDGLMMAGRCISGDFVAHASYRVTGNAVATGEAAGIAAALAATGKRQPHEVSWADCKAVLEKLPRSI
ncbi:FAD-dependent oxidoreductase [Blastopirellula sp. JC732]|uniref:FAD-dependent oxidoreductase n=1 Tax=Blastopirellula sediminis TaxID=2894196 RepID=A0A9X1MI22_9BACT|nr:FAD-dependent oxidoreductase [Blastopirellula sediminis]MCC9607709.1 FAD-dependent oxidoreductase [Blastopirellula sediminis]MCC9627498.1 FAD-dependent oxidoreductase [Blastopirellula sediminis]